MTPWRHHYSSYTHIFHLNTFSPSRQVQNNLSLIFLIKVHCKIMHSFIIRLISGHTSKHKRNGYSTEMESTIRIRKYFRLRPHNHLSLASCSLVLTILKYFFITINKMEIGQSDGDEHDFSLNSSCAFVVSACMCASWGVS